MKTGIESRKKHRRIALLNNASDRADTLPTPRKGLLAGRWL